MNKNDFATNKKPRFRNKATGNITYYLILINKSINLQNVYRNFAFFDRINGIPTEFSMLFSKIIDIKLNIPLKQFQTCSIISFLNFQFYKTTENNERNK